MALVVTQFPDLVRETSTGTGGTGNIPLGGAVSGGYQSFYGRSSERNHTWIRDCY